MTDSKSQIWTPSQNPFVNLVEEFVRRIHYLKQKYCTSFYMESKDTTALNTDTHIHTHTHTGAYPHTYTRKYINAYLTNSINTNIRRACVRTPVERGAYVTDLK